MKISKLIIVLVLLGGSVVSNAETIRLDRTQTVALALEQNERYQSILLEQVRIDGQYIEARSGAFPRLTFDASYLRNIDLSTSVFTMTGEDGQSERFTLAFGTPHNYTVGLNLYQPLYASGRVGAAIKIARFGRKYSSALIAGAKNNISVEADKAYLDALAAREGAEIFREAERLADSSLAVVRRLYHEGQTSEYDLLRAQVRAANSRPERIAAVNRARLALDNLRAVLALSSEVEIELEDGIESITMPHLPLAELINEALAQRPELEQSRQMINIRDRMVSIAKSGYRPDIGLTGRIGWERFDDDISKSSIANWNRSWNFGVVMTWPIFSGFETGGKVKQAKVDYSQSRLEESNLKRQIQLEVQAAWGNVNEATERVAALGETVGQATRGVDIARVRYDNGIGTQLELQDAEAALTRARVNKITALHDLALSVASLRRAVGRDWGMTW